MSGKELVLQSPRTCTVLAISRNLEYPKADGGAHPHLCQVVTGSDS